MKKLTKIYLNNNEQINFIVLAVFIVSLIFGFAINSIAIFLILLVAILNRIVVKTGQLNKFVYILVIYFGLIIINSLIHGSFKEIPHYLVKFSPFIIFPYCLQQLILSKKKLNSLLYLYVGSILIYCLVGIVIQFQYRYQIGHEIWMSAGGWAFFAWNLTHLFDFHAPYLGMYISLAILFILKMNNWMFDTRTKRSVLLTSAYIFLFIFLFFIGVKNSILFNVLLLIGLIIYHFSKKQYLPILVVIILSAIIFTIVPKSYLKQRFNNIMTSTEISKIDFERYNLNKIHFETMFEYPFLGTGIKEYSKIIKERYLHSNFESGVKENLNAHNQFLQTTVFFGFIGLIILSIIFYIAFRSSIINRDYLFLLFLILSLSAMLTESIFVTQRGIVFFSFFYVFLFLNNKNRIAIL